MFCLAHTSILSYLHLSFLSVTLNIFEVIMKLTLAMKNMGNEP